MLWEELTALDFKQAVQDTGGVCVLPLGVIEKHGNHLPLGTDMITATQVCKAAAEVEPAVVFPYYFLGQIAEARHVSGTLCGSHRLLMDALLEMCDEIARNGFKKILIMSGHGGNGHFLPFFAQEMPRLNRSYAVYTKFVADMRPDQRAKVIEAAKTDNLGYHAGIAETSLIMHLRPDLVKKSAQDPKEGESMGRISDVQRNGIFTGFNWYANFPRHFAGDHSEANPELGKLIFDIAVENTARFIKTVKEDTESLGLVNEYEGLCTH